MEATEDATALKEAMTSNEANGEELEASQEGSSNLEGSDNAINGDKESICRDFMRNVCTRGKRCKYAHPESKGETNNAATLLQVRKKIVKVKLDIDYTKHVNKPFHGFFVHYFHFDIDMKVDILR